MAAVPITVPGVGESITEGILARWLKPDGAAVKAGEPLFELETDKASNVVPAPAVRRAQDRRRRGDDRRDRRGRRHDRPRRPARRRRRQPAGPAPAAKPSTARRPLPAMATAADGAATALSPAVRRLVAEEQVDPVEDRGDRPRRPDHQGGRPRPPCTPRRQAAARQRTVPVAAPAPPRAAPRAAAAAGSPARDPPADERHPPADRPAAGRGPADRRDPDDLQRGRHVAGHGPPRASTRTRSRPSTASPSASCRSSSRRRSRRSRRSPAVNGRIDGSDIVYHNVYDIGVAVSTERGLMVPVLRDADQLSFAEIEKAIAAFAVKARDGTITVADLQGGTFTITNGGVFGSLLSTPILNPPQSGILGMHAIQKRPVAVDDQVVIRPMMYLALSYDHRIIDGREAVSFLVRIKECIENPERLMLEV